MPAAGPLTLEQVDQFEKLGYVLVDTPFDDAWIDAAQAAWARLTQASGNRSTSKEDDQGYVEAISHPYFEEVAKQILRTDRVFTIENGAHSRPPADAAPQHAGTIEAFDLQAEWDGGCHIDWQVTESDFDAAPRRDLCALWLWLNDVPAERAAMRILPGSHRTIMRHFEETLKPERRQWTPRHHPLFPVPPERYPTFPEYLPAPADFAYVGPEADVIPVVAKRGQLQVFTQSMLHNGSRNFDPIEPRKGMIVSYVAADVLFGPSLGGIYTKQQEGYRKMRAALSRWAPGREHIVPTGEEVHQWPTAPSHTHNGSWAESDLGEKWWPETFLPGHDLDTARAHWQEGDGGQSNGAKL